MLSSQKTCYWNQILLSWETRFNLCSEIQRTLHVVKKSWMFESLKTKTERGTGGELIVPLGQTVYMVRIKGEILQIQFNTGQIHEWREDGIRGYLTISVYIPSEAIWIWFIECSDMKRFIFTCCITFEHVCRYCSV